MKNGKLVASALAAVCIGTLYAAYTINGNNNSALGSMAGQWSTGAKVTAVGAGAYGQAENSNGSTFVGTASGVFGNSLNECVGIGHRSLRRATNCTGVVAIGQGAMENASGVTTNATWINGQIFACGDTLWLKDDPATADEDAPIYYSGGNLYLNAGNIYLRGGATGIEITDSSGNAVEAARNACDYYVSMAAGNDFNDGLTPQTPFATLDKALSVATNRQIVGVYPGRYPFPAFYNNTKNTGAARPIRLVSLSGASKTVLDHALGGANDGRLVGCMNTWTRFDGFTISGCKESSMADYKFLFSYFRNCIFENITTTNRSVYGVFGVSVLENCTVRNCTVVNQGNNSSWPGLSPSVFCDCILDGCVVSLSSPSSSRINLSNMSYLENCFVEADYIHSLETYRWLTSSNFGTTSGMRDCTLIAENVTYPNGWAESITYNGTHYSNPAIICNGCLVGVDGMEKNPGLHVETVVTNAQTVANALDGGTLRATDDYFDFRFFGYGSKNDRLTKNSIAREVLSSLADNEDAAPNIRLAASSALALRVAAAAASVSVRPTIADGMVLAAPEPPDGEEEEDGEDDGEDAPALD